MPVKRAKNQVAKHGGSRERAGRKPSTLKGLAKTLPRETAELLLHEIKAHEKWVKLSKSADERIVMDTLKYLTDRAHGKAPQAVDMNLSGSFNVTNLTDEEIAAKLAAHGVEVESSAAD